MTSTPRAAIQIETSAPQGITFLSWDSEQTGRPGRNLLREGTAVEVRTSGSPESSLPFIASGETPSDGPFWTASRDESRLEFRVHPGSDGATSPLLLVFPFNPSVTPTTLIPSGFDEEGRFVLPGVLSAPDRGLLFLSAETSSPLTATLAGDRHNKKMDLRIEIPAGGPEPLVVTLTNSLPEPPAGVPSDDPFWRQARRGWLNTFQPSSRWGTAGHKFSAPAGVLSNNVISDPVSFALWSYADSAFWSPEAAPGVSLMNQVCRTLDWWLENRVDPSGECVGYWDYRNFLDSNPSLIIAAWDYVEITGDLEWLRSRIGTLERLSAFLESRDIDGDGMLEAVQSGNRGTLVQPKRSSCWWDAINCGHKDGFSNALAYRAWRCLADLEKKLDRTDRQERYTHLADRLKQAYKPALYNPETGWLAWWRSEDGELHDYATPIVNGLAIEYGLVEEDLARDILARLRKKVDEAGFTRFELGIPCFLEPVPLRDYLHPDGLGCPHTEDGRDTFGQYMNGGIFAGQTFHWLAAHYRVGETAYADDLLRRMLGHLQEGGFQNGVADSPRNGIDWTDWEGKPCGYEGYLSDNYRFLQAVAIRHPELRRRFYRVLE